MGLISTSEAAEKLGVHITRVQVLIREGRLPAQRIGRNYVVNEADLKLVEDRKTGRPPKPSAETTAKLNKAFREAKEAEEVGKMTTAEKAVLKSEAPQQASTKKVAKKAGKKQK